MFKSVLLKASFLFFFFSLAWQLFLPLPMCADRGIVPVSIASPGSDERRNALVIGNGSYEAAPLRNPLNDARDMAAKLEALGFDVELVVNGTMRQMEEAVRRFGRKLRGGGVGLFYYAGHGIQVEGRNYMVPVNAQINDEVDVKYEAVDVGRVLDTMNLAGNQVNIVILDACRNNPYARSFRSPSAGLARMDAPTGTLIAYATAPGRMAADGTGRNSIYTSNLLKYMDVPGLPVEQLFKNVRKAVLKESDGRQVPWESSSLVGDFYFLPPSGKRVAGKPVPLPTPAAAKPRPSPAGVGAASAGRRALLEAVSWYVGYSSSGMDWEKARLLFIEADEQGDPLARMWLARLYFRGRCGFAKDEERGRRLAAQVIDHVRKRAKAGDAEAMFLLGSAYDEGLGVEADPVKVVYWYRKAVEKGNAPAMNNLAWMYYEGRGVPQDYDKAVYWFSKAAEKGEADAMFNLGLMYQSGLGVARDYEKAVYWFSKAGEKGYIGAIISLGMMYENGLGVARDYKKAVHWYRKGAEKGFAPAMTSLGVMYVKGQGVGLDYDKAQYWFSKAAEKDDADAMFNLGMMYANGFGVARDYGKAKYWFSKAAEKGYISAMFSLGVMYERGQGTARDYKKAVSWYSKAAEKGDADAMFNLGVMYANGFGVGLDYDKAKNWFSKAAEKGQVRAMNNLGVMYERGQGIARDYKKAVSWYRKAAEKGFAIAMKNLGVMYEKGLGVERDYNKAREWYSKAAAAGDEEAKRILDARFTKTR